MINETTTVNLIELSKTRHRISSIKSNDTNLVKRELLCHQFTINEYKDKIINHLYKNEFNSNTPNLSCFNSQPSIDSNMRCLIFEFIVCCHARLSLSTKTLFATFNLIDNYTSKFIIKNYNYQLLALTSLWIASKNFDLKRNTPTLNMLRNLCCNTYSKQQFRDMELHILKSFDWSLSMMNPTPDTFIDLNLFQRVENNHNQVNINNIRILSLMLCELTYFNLNLRFKTQFSNLSNLIVEISIALETNNLTTLTDFEVTFLKDLFNTNFNIPSCFHLKYDNFKISKILDFKERVTNLNDNLILDDYFGPIIDTRHQQQQEEIRLKHTVGSKTSAIITNNFMPLTPTTPVYTKKRYLDELDDEEENEHDSCKRICN